MWSQVCRRVIIISYRLWRSAGRAAGLLLIGPRFGEQFANIHNSIGQFTGLKGGCARLDGASLPPAMIFAKDISIAAQQGFEHSRVQSRVTLSRRNRSRQVCFGLAPFTLPDIQLSSCAEEFDPVHRNCILGGGEDGDSTVQSPAGFAISPIVDVEAC